jgi:hypothetical protein
MKTVYSAATISIVSVFRSIMEGQGISCRIRNEYLSAGMGELPPIECWAQLCVEDDDYSEVKRIVEEALSVKEMIPWKCGTCGEEIEGQFTECWKCGESHPSAD